MRYYYQHPDGTQEALGGDFNIAKKRCLEIHTNPIAYAPGSFTAIADQFETHALAGLSVKTQYEYRLGLKRLRSVFKHAPIASIKPGAVGSLMHELRETPFQANRLKALLSRVWNWARSRGLTSAPNPCTGVEGFPEPPRAVVVTGAMFWAVYDQGDQVLRDWLRLDIMIGQRVTDVLRIKRTDICAENGRRWIGLRSTKTGVGGHIDIENELVDLVDELLARPRAATGPWLIQTDAGQRVTYNMISDRFNAARNAARELAAERGEPWQNWQMSDVRKASLNQAKTLEEARRRGLHTDPRTTARHYEIIIAAVPGRLPKRS